MKVEAARAGIRPWKVLAAGLLLLASYLSLRNAIVLMAGSQAPELALSFWPPAGEPLMRLHLEPHRSTPAQARAAAISGMQRAPLSELPFLIAAEQARQSGDFARSGTLANIAVRRHSRRGYGRGKLLQLHVQRANWSGAIEEIRLLWTQQPRTNEMLAQVLLLLAKSDVRAKALLIRKMRDDPAWGRSVVATARKKNRKDPLVGELQRLLEVAPTRTAGSSFVGHYSDWVATLPSSELRKLGTIFNGRFEQSSVSSPFTWRFGAGASISASAEHPGLQISGSATAAREIAAQHLVLPRGRFRIHSEQRDVRPSRLSWTIQCIGGMVIGRLDLSSERASRQDFEVPAGCPLQRLTLISAATTQPLLNARITFVEIVPAL